MSLRQAAKSAGLLSIAVLLSSFANASAADMPVKAFKAVPDNPFFIVNDNRLTYAYFFDATSPGVTARTAKQVYAYTHFDVWAYGTNLFNVALFKSDQNDPAVGCPVLSGGGCRGATEIYGFFRSTLGFNELFNTKAFSIGPLRGVSFEFGADANTENNPFDPAKRDVVAGLQFAFNLPYKGFFNVAPLYYKEINNNGFLKCGVAPCLADGHVEYRGTWAVETNYYMDLGFLPEYLPLAISGRAAWYGPKGNENRPLGPESGGVETKIEFNSEPIRLTLDASKLVWGNKYSHLVDVWVAYRYWQNKFGLDHKASFACTSVPGSCTEESLSSGVSVKF